jgi:hypothetical protein
MSKSRVKVGSLLLE